MECVIIGGGLSGLWLGQRLIRAGIEVTLLEKSRGLGGRLATRRIADATFDHGAQFYVLKDPILPAHQRWLHAGVCRPWPGPPEDPPRFNGTGGMTALAKNLASGINVRLWVRVTKIVRDGSSWKIETDPPGPEILTKHIILSAPLPQACELVESNGIEVPAKLKSVTYQKAIVALVQAPTGISKDRSELSPTGLISTIMNQHAKGVSAVPAWTVTMNPNFSEEFYAAPDAEVSERVVRELSRLDSTFGSGPIEIKRWRYSQPIKTAEELFAEVAPKFWLIGDGFGGPSLNGAMRSGTALGDLLVNSLDSLKTI